MVRGALGGWRGVSIPVQGFLKSGQMGEDVVVRVDSLFQSLFRDSSHPDSILFRAIFSREIAELLRRPASCEALVSPARKGG